MRAPGVAAVFLFCAAGAGLNLAQEHTYLSGLVLDPSEARIPGALVGVVNQETGFRRMVETQSDGSYRIVSLEPGIYKITVRKLGFRTLIRLGVALDSARPVRVDFTLPVGNVEETITVEGTADSLDAAGATLATVVGREEFERLPLNQRGLLSLLEFAPGITVTPATRGEAGQFTVNGQRPNANYFSVDGASTNTGVSGGGLPAQCTGGSLPGMTAFGSLHSLLSLEAAEEFRVETSAQGAEFGRLPGGLITLSSRTGSNQFHGSLSQQFRHETLAANDWFANRSGGGRGPLRLHDFAATLGGPARRNRTFFFLAYQGMRLRQPFAWRMPVPSQAERERAPDWLRPLADLFPQPNGPDLGGGLAEWTGRNHRPSRLDTGSVRIDHALNPRLTLFGRYNESPSFSEFGSHQVARLDLSWRSGTFGMNLRGGPGSVVDVRLNASGAGARSSWRQPGITSASACYLGPVTAVLLGTVECDYLFRFSLTGASSLVDGREGIRRQGQLQASGTVDLTRGAHRLRLGADYRRLALSRWDTSPSLSVIADSLDDVVERRDLWIASAGPVRARSRLTELSLFATDTWTLASSLNATYGLRWEHSPAPVPNQPEYFLGAGGGPAELLRRALWRTRYANLAPRFGLAQRLGSGHTVLRAGAGLYYDSSLSLAADLVNSGPLNMRQYGSGRNAPFSTLMSYGFLPDLRLPLVKHWNASFEHAFAGRDLFSVAYAGSAGRRLVRREMGGQGSTETFWLAVATNHGSSNYHGLQAQYRRRLSRRLQGLVSYTWSHSLDNSSSDALLYWAGEGVAGRPDRASSDFDVRHSLTAAFSLEAGTASGHRGVAALLRGWAVDGILRARTGFPINLLVAEHYTGVALANAFRPDLVAGEPVWISDAAAPGGLRLNRAAFRLAPAGVQGGLGRNAITGFGMTQLDLALRRHFPLGAERSLELRIEAFNALNHPNFADPNGYLSSPLFGQSLSLLNLMLGTGSPGSGLAPMLQTGGARSVQAVLRFRF
ncbi:MAG: TonB-dependent receptor [Bryobacterales bacterium]|nr:TonB-dependent receptor [Bryobacterales bacterium]